MTKKERRVVSRTSTFSGMHYPVEIRASHNQTISAILHNLSSHGALLELERRQSLPLRVNERISVKFRLPHDVVWLAGVVRHCSALRLGVFFPEGVGRMLSKTYHSPQKAIPLIRHHRAPKAVLQSL